MEPTRCDHDGRCSGRLRRSATDIDRLIRELVCDDCGETVVAVMGAEQHAVRPAGLRSAA